MASGVAGCAQEIPRQIWNMPGGFTWPFSMKRLASSRWPVSNTSSSGVTPASRIATAMASRWPGVLTKTCGPMFMLPMSRLQMSGLSSTTWRTRSAGDFMVVPGPCFERLVGAGTKRAPGPVVRLIRTSVPLALIRSTTSR